MPVVPIPTRTPTRGNLINMKVGALEVYRASKKYYSILAEDNGGICALGKQLVDAIPADPDTLQGGSHYNPH